jgi:hypothetical protein
MARRRIRARRARHLLISIPWACACIIALSSKAAAYVDPGTGSYILQLVIAGVLGSFFTIKLLGKRIKAFILGRFSRDKDAPEDDPAGIDE